jgi:hypothetical protein
MAISESAREKNIRFSTMTIPTPISLTRSIEQVGTTVENTMERVAATRQLFT